MRVPARLVTVAALVGASFALSAPAQAECVGSQTYALVCVTVNLPPVDPNGNTFDDCIHVVVPPCVYVTFDYPSVGPVSSDPVDITCSGMLMPRCPEFSS